MRLSCVPATFGLLWLLLLAPRPLAAQAQITAGAIQGTVVDTSGAVVPGVTVEAANVETNLVQSRATGPDGRFVFLQLPSGRYKLTFSLAGFATVVREDVALTVGQSITLTQSLSVSTVSETVTVSGAPAIETTRAAQASTLNQITVENTPILGRKFEDLLT